MSDLYETWASAMSAGMGPDTSIRENGFSEIIRQEQEEAESRRPSLRAALQRAYTKVGILNALKTLEKQGYTVDQNELLPMEFGGVAVLDYDHPETSIIPAGLLVDLPQTLTTESLIEHSRIATERLKDALGGR